MEHCEYLCRSYFFDGRCSVWGECGNGVGGGLILCQLVCPGVGCPQGYGFFYLLDLLGVFFLFIALG